MKMLNEHSFRFAEFFSDEKVQEIAKELAMALQSGSICIPSEPYKSFFEKENSHIGSGLHDPKPFVLENDAIYIYRYFQYQEKILEKIKELVSRNQILLNERVSRLSINEGLRYLIDSMDKDRETDWQTIAAIMAYLADFAIITGGPGTGKTTSVAKVLMLVLSENSQAEIKMAAPTGKAAYRMEQALKGNSSIPENLREKIQSLKASTIHRLLGTNHLSPYFKHDAGNPISADVLIIDESSMLDVALFAKLLDAVGPDTRLILLGDQNQLSSVEAGSLFGDICGSVSNQNELTESFRNTLSMFLPEDQVKNTAICQQSTLLQSNLVALNFSYRFKDDQKIGQLSKETVRGNWEGVKEILLDQSTPDQLVVDESYDPSILQEFAGRYSEYIEEPNISLAIKKLEKIRILAAVKMGKKGIYEINRQVERILAQKGLIRPNSEFYENRPLLVSKNYHDLSLFNGDIGIVRNNTAWFLDEKGEPRAIAPGLIADVETVFAMTIHKSQGSEFDQVLIVLPDKTDVEILTRELVYTAITRAKSKLLIQGTLDVLQTAISRKVTRASRLKEKLLSLL